MAAFSGALAVAGDRGGVGWGKGVVATGLCRGSAGWRMWGRSRPEGVVPYRPLGLLVLAAAALAARGPVWAPLYRRVRDAGVRSNTEPKQGNADSRAHSLGSLESGRAIVAVRSPPLPRLHSSTQPEMG